MHAYRRVLHSLGFSTPKRDSTSLPDYYRSTRLEEYGPFYRSSKSVGDLMKTIELPRQDSPSSVCAFPDVFEDDVLDELGFSVGPKFDQADVKAVCEGTQAGCAHDDEKGDKWFEWPWRIFLSPLRKCYGRRHQTGATND